VKVGLRLDSGLWVIEGGLKPSDEVVVEGLQRIADNMTVRTKPMADAAPVATSGKK
jgi:multidrug efflux pump subunit AcrA (membrane-fusion protein)